MSDTTRAKRKDSKRRQTPISVLSDRSRDKRLRSVKSAVASHDDGWKGDDELEPPRGWDENNKCLAALAVEQDRRSRAYTDDGQRSRETAQRNVHRLVELRVGEDREIAEELLLRDLQELEDRRLAEQLADQEDGLEQSKRIAAEQQQKIAAIELQLQLERAKAEQYESVTPSWESKPKPNKAQKSSGTSLPEEPRVPMSGTKLNFGNRVILQRYRIADIAKTGHSQIPEQGIQWGEDAAKPKVKETLEQSLANQAKRELRDSMKTNGFYERAGTAPKTVPKAPPSDDSSSSSSSSSSEEAGYKPERNYSRSEVTDSALDTDSDSQSSSGSSSTPNGEHRRSRGGGKPPGGGKSSDSGASSSSSRKQKHSKRRNSRRKHHKKPKKDLVEPGDPVGAGLPVRQMKKWRHSLHKFYIEYDKEMLGKKCNIGSVFDENRNFRFPAPPKYDGSSDITKFDEHIMTMYRWLQVMGLGGRKNDYKRLLNHSFYLTGPAKDWYDQNVTGLHRTRRNWTYLDMILGLFDRFIDTSCIQEATERFWSTKFSRDIGIMGYYYELMNAARRMIKRPDSYTFKQQLMSRMPADMVNDLIRRNITAEYSNISDILENARNFEWHDNVARRYTAIRADRRRSHPLASTSNEKPATKTDTKSGNEARDSPQFAGARPEEGHRRW
ncbi:hypothetical protein C8J57DRAFT_1489947 [Mycena rebaudengoi]|nr:hypothetical protein C8J57DRAFT_1489947 [Mycena rebaudengoi]